ncbi:MAG: MarR family transcriptional regulator [Prolixibacteraceae bacterium]|jgi:DNA-binding MarR family transcriptional regulator|nr:MarR family transcriptional regulator [Prolixibacteraceae bacterium]
MGRYDSIKQLIDYYERYEKEEKNPDLLSFSNWMTNQLEEEPELNKKLVLEKRSGELKDNIQVLKTMEIKARFLEAISSIARYHEFYSRKALKDLEINSRIEFLFLQTIGMAGKIKKTDLINAFHTEYTTGMDTIRRLLKNELLIEVVDQNDKRAKLLELTPKGINVLALAQKNMLEEHKMFLMIFNDNKWKKALFILEEINDLHQFVYENHNEKPFAEICNLMDSLKYLYR